MNLAAPTSAVRPADPDDALARLVNREEVLQICYWFQGEGFGDCYDAALLRPFLQCDAAAIDMALRELAAQGDLQDDAGRWRFTDKGQREAGRLFADGFADFQKQGHGECDAGCCDGDDHSKCGDECPLH
ncbi:MAG: hypothetical protein ABIQ29_01275 [Burkholderiaceae bacterium]